MLRVLIRSVSLKYLMSTHKIGYIEKQEKYLNGLLQF